MAVVGNGWPTQDCDATTIDDVILRAYLFFAGVQLLYASSRFLNLARAVLSTRCFTDNPEKEKAGKIPTGNEPPVTIQICTYNEGQVVEETIRCACSVDWPKHKLIVQVLDDSTDPLSRQIVEDAVHRWRVDHGIDIVKLSRPDRRGYKGGSLRYHFDRNLHTDFVAQFDADHRMEPDFLRRVMPFFFDCQGNEKTRIGLVQTPWAYYNIHQNILTETDAIALDVHHVLEQQGRGAFLKVFGFNGTGGVWRKCAIEDAGGWNWDTVTEDLAISYDAFCAGYEFIYVRSCPQMLECPSGILAHTQQKHRWTKGFFQVFRLSYPNILRSRKAGFFVKLEAFYHMTAAIQFFWCLVLIVLQPLLIYRKLENELTRTLSTIPSLGILLEVFVSVFAKVSSRKNEYKSFAERCARLLFVLPFFSLKFGMALFELRAIADGLTSNDATFLATPKEGANSYMHGDEMAVFTSDQQYVKSKTDSKLAKSANKADSTFTLMLIALTNICLAAYRLRYFLAYDLSSKATSLIHFWYHTMNFCVCIGCIWIGSWYLYASATEKSKLPARFWSQLCLGIKRKFFSNKQRPVWGESNFPTTNKEPSVRKAAQSQKACSKTCVQSMTGTQKHLFFALTILFVYSALLAQHNMAVIRFRNGISSYFRQSFSCPVSFPAGAARHKTFVVFAQPHTGSTRLMDLIDKLGKVSNPTDLQILMLYELFLTGHDKSQAYRIASVTKTMAGMCDIREMKQHEAARWTSLDMEIDIEQSPLSYMDKIEELSKETWQKEVADHLRRRSTESELLLQYLQGIPSWSKHPYIAFKVLEHHLSRHLMTTPKDFIQLLVRTAGQQGLKVAVLWRRRMIEGFVHNQKAYLSTPTVRVDKEDLEQYVQQQRAYYTSIVSALVDAGIKFKVLEFERNLSELSLQKSTLNFLLGAFETSTKQFDIDEVFKFDQAWEKALAPVEDFVENWEEVVSWGYGGETEEWPDFLEIPGTDAIGNN